LLPLYARLRLATPDQPRIASPQAASWTSLLLIVGKPTEAGSFLWYKPRLVKMNKENKEKAPVGAFSPMRA
jgi:hypothetical protein